jgi:hypothetical protein
MTSSRTKKLTPSRTNASKIYDLYIESTDWDGMEMSYETLPSSMKRSQTGSGFDFFSGRRDHHFVVRGASRANKIAKHYKKILVKRKRGGCGVMFYDRAAVEREELEEWKSFET